jgi:signal transduction histidine kinase/CheY-like chemotaxis protein
MKDGVMNRDEKRVSGHPNDNDGASDTDDPGQPGVSSQRKDSLPAVLEKNSTHMESVIIDDEADLLSREKLVTAREDAAHLRENAADLREDAAWLREGTATSREQEIRAAGTIQAASENHMIMLQQVNARLVIATIEAQKLAEQVQTAKAQLESAKHVAEKASLAKSDFLSSMSHELRTPLNAILGFAQLLEAGPPPPTAAQIVRLHQIIKAGWYLLELINEILDLAVIESGKLSLSREPVSLIDVMRECQAMVESQAQKHGIHINFLPFDNTWFANADRTRVKQILINLLSNAIKYNREHGTVEVKCISSNPERIHISIKDSGAGLPPEKLAQLFQPFNRLGQETGSREGTGIGLVVTKLLVELMGGTIGVESTVGVGSEFWIELIRDVTPQPAGNTMPAELAPQAQENAPLRTLLYVEDNPANLMLVKQIIEGNPHLRILSARDGNLGIALARAHLPDVILMDINLPDISGIEALNILREDPATAHIPVVALSANAMLRDIEKGLEAGFFLYLTKPIKVNEFMNALDEALKFSEMGLANTNETGEIR